MPLQQLQLAAASCEVALGEDLWEDVIKYESVSEAFDVENNIFSFSFSHFSIFFIYSIYRFVLNVKSQVQCQLQPHTYKVNYSSWQYLLSI